MIQRKWYIALIMFFAFMPISYGVVRTINLSSSSQVSGTLAIANGGTSGTTASAARTALGVANYTASDSSWTNGETLTISHGSFNNVNVTGYKTVPSTPTRTTLLHFDGADGSTTITDTGSNGGSHTWTAIGNAQLDTAEKKFGSASAILDGSGDRIQLTATSDMLFTGDFTISFQLRIAVINGIHVLMAPSDISDNFQLAVYSDGRIDFYAGSTQVCTSSAGVITANTWKHIALTRSGSTVKIWVDGVEVASGTRSGTIGRSDSNFNFGMYADGSYPLNGHFDELAVNTTCLYSGSFTPPSSAWEDSGNVLTGLRHGTDYTYTFDTSGTYVTNASGSTLSSVRFDVLPSN